VKSLKKDYARLKDLLMRAYHEKGKSEVDELWQMRVMAFGSCNVPLNTGIGRLVNHA